MGLESVSASEDVIGDLGWGNRRPYRPLGTLRSGRHLAIPYHLKAPLVGMSSHATFFTGYSHLRILEWHVPFCNLSVAGGQFHGNSITGLRHASWMKKHHFHKFAFAPAMKCEKLSEYFNFYKLRWRLAFNHV